MQTQQDAGFVVWLTGMNRAGKSSLAAELTKRLAGAGRGVQLLDEDGDAALLLEGLGATKDDRTRAVQRLGFVAKAVARGGGIAVVAALSPYRDAREQLRREAKRFVEVFVDCGMETLQARDPENIYKRALAGELRDVPGVDVPYEPPLRPEVVVKTDQEPVAAAAVHVFQALVDAKLVGPAEFGRLTGGQRPKRKPARGGGRRKLSAKAAARKAPKRQAARSANAARSRR